MSGRARTVKSVLLVGSHGLSGAFVGGLDRLTDTVLLARNAATAARLRAAFRPEVIMVDARTDGAAAERAVRELRESAACSPVVVLTGTDGGSAIAGADGTVSEALNETDVQRILGVLAATDDGDGLEGYFSPRCPPGVPLAGRSKAIVRTLELIRLVGASACNPVLILGETGTGKELAAQAVHACRCGKDRPFIAVNCAALTASLLESELFGHVKSAFTGADCDKTGLFEAAGNGAVFLDEISEMDVQLQAKLLRVLQEKSFRKVGGTTDIPCRATIIASSNRKLTQEVAKGAFRKDLYYRLAVFPISMPALRDPDRRDDVGLLADYFAATTPSAEALPARALSSQAKKKLLDHPWPGNVRELRNVIERAVILERSDRIQASSIIFNVEEDPSIGGPAGGAAAIENAQDFSLETAEKEFILRALNETGWQRTRAAALLGITRATLHAKLKRYDIRPPDRADAVPVSAEGAQ